MSRLIAGWQDVIDTDLPAVGPITEEIRQQTLKEAFRFRGGLRIATGRFWTDKEYEDYRNKVLGTKLP